jgi:hypothetical protein
MWLVLCDGDDADASWAHRELERRGVVPIELVTTRELLAARRWVHRLGRDGCTAEVTLGDGRVIASGEVRGVLNRIATLSVERFAQVGEPDRAYAEQEFIALLLSWLRCFAHSLNPPAPGGLCGQWRSSTEWRLLAARAGLPVTPLHRTVLDAANGSAYSDATATPQPQRALVVDGQVVSDDDVTPLHTACRSLADLARTPLLQVDLSRGPTGELHFAAASPLPALHWAGAAAIDALAEALSR